MQNSHLLANENAFENILDHARIHSFLTTLQPITPARSQTVLSASLIVTPVGEMIALADKQALYFLDFTDHPKLHRRIRKLQLATKSTIVPGETALLQSVARELHSYFFNTLSAFKTPLLLVGSPFQKQTWEALLTIPYGTTVSYKGLAYSLAKPTASRAVANANGANNIALIIPCHRVIASNGDLGGYGSGVARKQKLLTHEQTTHNQGM